MLRSTVSVAFSFALLKAGNSIAAKIAMIAITTNSSINVKPGLTWLARFMPSRELFHRQRQNRDRIRRKGAREVRAQSRDLFGHWNDFDPLINGVGVVRTL